MKLKSLLQETKVWERKFGEPLPTLADTKKMLNKYNLGLYLNGSDEIRPGYKDYDSLSEILEGIDESF